MTNLLLVRSVVVGVVLAPAISAPLPVAAPGGPVPTRLTEGSIVEGEMAPGETHAFEIELRAGEYLQLLIEQDGANVRQILKAPDGTVVLETETPAGPIGPNPLAVVAPAAGVYRLDLRPARGLTPPRRYELRVEAIREPGPSDRLRARIIRATEDGFIAYTERQQPATALALYREALDGWEALGDRRMQLWTNQMIGYVHSQGFDQYKEAYERYSRSLAMALDLRDEYAEARLSHNLGHILRRLGRLDEAKTLFERAFALHRAGGREESAANSASALGVFHALVGEPQAALDRFHDAIRGHQAAGTTRGEAGARLELGKLYLRLGDPELALEQLELAFPSVTKEPHVQAQCVTQTGIARFQLGDFPGARKAYTDALAIYKTLENRILEADTYSSLAELDQEEGNFQSARELFTSALAVYQDRDHAPGMGRAQCGLGDALRRLGDLAGARASLHAARALAPRGGAPVGACAEAGLARVARDAGDLEAARAHAEAALEQAESGRRVASDRLRASALARSQPLYELLIDVHMRRHAEHPRAGHDAAAFEVAERARARSLLESLGESAVDVRQGVGPELLAEEGSLRRRFNAAATEQMEARTGGRMERAAALDRDVDRLSAELAEAEARIRRASPRYAALTHPRPLGLDEIRARVLDRDTQFLQYALGEEASYLWVVSSGHLASFRLASREEIETAAHRVHELMSAPGSGAPSALGDASRALSRLVLAPAAHALDGRRLLVVAPGALQMLPLGSLPLGDGAPLLARFEVVNAPSASVIATLRADAGGRRRPGKVAAVFADPVFERSDPRLAARGRTVAATLAASRGAEPSASHERALRGLRGRGVDGGLGRLPFSRREAEAIAALTSPPRAWKATGFEASREAVSSDRLADYRIVHFATHGVLNTRRPELSGVVLSLFDERGRKQDGFLRLHDVYNLRLDADLVVLSGCQTALGKDLRGEGLVGLTRGFMYAGARAVVASLWKVDDESTAELMTRFYRGMLKEGRRPADALRAAQLEMSRSRRWSAPFHWAGFVLQGEWR